MVIQNCNSILALRIFRVAGCFPYQVRNFASLHATGEFRAPRSWPWFTWSLVIGTLHVLLCYIEISAGFKIGVPYDNPTLKVSRALYFSYRGVIGFVMFVQALVYSPRLAMAVSHANHMCHSLKFPTVSIREVLTLILLLLHMALILLLCFSELILKYEALSLNYCGEVLTHVFKNVYLSIITIMYGNCIYILTAAYSKVTERITSLKHTTKFESKTRAASLTSKQHEASEDMTDEDFDSIGRQLLGLQAFNHQINRYFGQAIVMVVAYCLFTSIISIFYFSLFSYINVKTVIFTCVYTFLGTQPLIMLNNTSVQINTKKDDLLSVLTMTKYQTDAVQDLKNLAKDFPNFKMCGFFSLDRKLLVNIFSFIATYVIILLQFHLGEK